MRLLRPRLSPADAKGDDGGVQETYFQSLSKDAYGVSTEDVAIHARSMDDLRNKKITFFLSFSPTLISLCTCML